MWHWLEIKKHCFSILMEVLSKFVHFKHRFICTVFYNFFLKKKNNMHNYEMFIWMLFLLIQWGLIWRKTNTWHCVVALVLSLFFDANMNYVHCINAYNEDLDDDDFWSMFCKPLLYRIIFSVMLHVAALCVFSWKRLLIKSNSWVIFAVLLTFSPLSELNACLV